MNALLIACIFGVVECLFLGTQHVVAPPDLTNLRRMFEQALAEYDEGRRIRVEEPEYARRLFRSSAQRFASIIASGVVNGRLEFNLANAHLQSGDLGRAILHYRRAERLAPRDSGVAHNLAVARSRCLVSIQPTRDTTLTQSILFWHYRTAATERMRVAAILYVTFWLLLALRSAIRRRWVTMTIVACVTMVLVSGGSVAASHWADRNTPEGVVTATDVVVYEGPGTAYHRRLRQPLQPGVEFTLRKRRGAWWNIELANTKRGWIEATTAELVGDGG